MTPELVELLVTLLEAAVVAIAFAFELVELVEFVVAVASAASEAGIAKMFVTVLAILAGSDCLDLRVLVEDACCSRSTVELRECASLACVVADVTETAPDEVIVVELEVDEARLVVLDEIEDVDEIDDEQEEVVEAEVVATVGLSFEVVVEGWVAAATTVAALVVITELLFCCWLARLDSVCSDLGMRPRPRVFFGTSSSTAATTGADVVLYFFFAFSFSFSFSFSFPSLAFSLSWLDVLHIVLWLELLDAALVLAGTGAVRVVDTETLVSFEWLIDSVCSDFGKRPRPRVFVGTPFSLSRSLSFFRTLSTFSPFLVAMAGQSSSLLALSLSLAIADWWLVEEAPAILDDSDLRLVEFADTVDDIAAADEVTEAAGIGSDCLDLPSLVPFSFSVTILTILFFVIHSSYLLFQPV